MDIMWSLFKKPIFHITRTNNLKIGTETQKIPNSQHNLNKEEQSWWNHSPSSDYTTKQQSSKQYGNGTKNSHTQISATE